MSAQRIPLAPSQRGIYFLHRFAPDSAVYNVPVALRVRGPLSLERLQRAVDALTVRHEALRTTFAEENGWPVQVIHPPQEAPRVAVTVGHTALEPDGDPASSAAFEAERRAAAPFDLAQGPLWRVDVAAVGADDRILTLTFDHIIVDEVSIAVLARDLRAAYADPHSLPDADAERGYAECCRYELGEPDTDGGEYWRRSLRGAQARPLPHDPVTPPAKDAAPFDGERLRFRLDESTAKLLPKFCAAHRVTPFVVFHAAFVALLHGWTGGNDILIGAAVDGRPDSRFEETVGYFQNTVVLRTAVESGDSFADLVARGRRTVLAALHHRRTPFEAVVEAVRPARGGTSNPLFQAAIGYNRVRIDRGWQLDGVEIEPVPFDWPITQFDLNLFLQQDGGAILGEITFNPARLQGITMLRLAAAFRAVLAAAFADAGQKVGDLPRLQDVEVPPRPARPARIPLSYAQRGLWFLHHLMAPGAACNAVLAIGLHGPTDVTALSTAVQDLVDRHESLRTVFVRIDGEPCQVVRGPAEHGLHMRLVETTDEKLDEVLSEAGRRVFDLAAEVPVRATLFCAPGGDTLLLVLHRIVFDAESLGPLARDLGRAYAARRDGRPPDWEGLPAQYTDFVLWQRARLGTTDDTGSLAARQAEFWRRTLTELPEELSLPRDRVRRPAASYHADVVPVDWDADLHAALAAVARGCGTKLSMVVHTGLAALLSRHGDGADIPLGAIAGERGHEAFRDLVGCFSNAVVLRTDVSGDPTFRQLLDRVRDCHDAALAAADLPFDRVVAVANPARLPSRHPLFQVMISVDRAPSAELPALSIRQLASGASQLDLSVSLRDSYFADGVPAGVRGTVEYATDLFDRATAEALAHRLERLLRRAAADPDQRLSTLDGGAQELARLAGSADKPMTSAGRAAAELASHPWVADVAVMGEPGHQVAYVVPTAIGVTERELRAYLAGRLPGAWIPALVRLGALPRTPAGELDRKALPSPRGPARRPPSTPMEKALHPLFARFLGRLGVDDDFFALGCDSLLALRLAAVIGQELAVRVPVKLVYAKPTVAALACELDTAVTARNDGKAAAA